jgi:hypothetical protein
MKMKDYFGVGEVLTYFFRKKDPNRPVNFNIKAMHWTNRISITVFLVGLIIYIIKLISRNF